MDIGNYEKVSIEIFLNINVTTFNKTFLKITVYKTKIYK